LHQVTDEFRSICARYCDGADKVIHLGDWVAGSVLDFMERYPLEAVSGNMDPADIQDRLPIKKVIRLKGHRLGIIHGWGAPFDLRKKLYGEFEDVDAILFGHTHQAMQAEENGIFWFNPGSVSMGRGGSPRSLGILHIGEGIRGEIILL